MTGAGALSSRSFSVASFYRQLRLFPSFPAARNIPKIDESQRFQNTRGDARAIAAATVNSRWLFGVEFSHSFAEFRDKNVMRTGNMSLLPFAGRTHIDNLQRRLSIIQFVHAHLSDSFQWESCRVPCLHSTDEVSTEFCITGAHK